MRPLYNPLIKSASLSMQSKTWNSFSVELPQKPWRASDQNSVSDGALPLVGTTALKRSDCY
jgi:hypothetical protein